MEQINAFGENSKKSEKQRPVFGIDLGTTNSAISVIREGNAPETIRLTSGKYTMPSCVMYDHGKIIVGDEAYKHRDQENTVYSVKRHMQDPNAVVKVRDCNERLELKPEEVSAEILKGLVEQTGGLYGEIKDVVVTVPAYFDQNGVSATKRACELAGLNVIGIANEPTAASLCYDLKPEDGGKKDVVVYDLGGGTFDITLMRITNGKSADAGLASIYGFDTETNSNDTEHSVVTLSIDGDTHLGGDDIDEALLQIVGEKLRDQYHIDMSLFTSRELESMKLRLEQFKKMNVETSMYQFHVDTIDKTGRHVEAQIMIKPDDFRDSAMRIFEKSKIIVDRLLRSVPNDADTIVLTGGSTKNYWIRRAIAAAYPSMHVDDALSPDLSVSQGAAIQGKVTKFGDSGIKIFDILPITVGVKDSDGRMVPMIPKSTSLPTVKSLTFTTDEDNQKCVTVELLQGNSVYADECVSLGKLHIDGIEPKPAGVPDLAVSVSISADRIMHCIATIDGKREEITLDLSGETKAAEAAGDKTVRRLLRAGAHMSTENKAKLEEMVEALGSKYTVEQVKEFIRINRNGEN